MLTPNAFSIRSAISGESAALPFNRSDSVARRTLRISAVRATVRSSSLRISSRMKAPGCGGLMPIFTGASSINGNRLDPNCRSRPVKIERDPPIARYGNAPGFGPITGQLVNALARRTDNASHVLARDQRRENVPHAVYKIAPNASMIIRFEKAPQTGMADASNDHRRSFCTVSPYKSSAGRFCQREPEPAIVQMAGGPVARRHLAQYRRFAAAARHRIGAACVEMAARGRIDRARHITGQDDAVAALGARLWDWHRR